VNQFLLILVTEHFDGIWKPWSNKVFLTLKFGYQISGSIVLKRQIRALLSIKFVHGRRG